MADECAPSGAEEGEAARAAAAARVRERLAASEEERRAGGAARRAAAAAAADPRESVAAFAARADARRTAAEAELAALESASANAAAAPTLDAAAARARVDAVRQTLLELEQDVAASAYFLPKYDARTAASTVAALRERCDAAEAAAAPRRKFAFSSRKAAAAPAPDAAAAAATASAAAESAAAAAAAAALAAASLAAAAAAPPTAGLRGCRGGVHVLRRAALGAPDADFTLEDLQDCDVFVLGGLRALRLRNLARVRVYAAPVAGSAFVDGATSCALHIAARQVRIHSSTDTEFYLRVRSRPIIEDTSRVRFAPYEFGAAFPGGVAAAAAAGLRADLASDVAAWSGLWRCVDDFAWLRASASPNWAELEEDERVAPPQPPQPKPGEADEDAAADRAVAADAAAAAQLVAAAAPDADEM